MSNRGCLYQPPYYTLYHMAILKQRVCEGSIRQPGQVAGAAISIPRWMSPYKPNLRMRSRFWRQFQTLHLHSAMEQQKTRRLSLSLKRPLSERFQAVAGEEISQSKKPYVLITRGAQLTGQLGRLSNGGISTIPNRTNPSAHVIF